MADDEEIDPDEFDKKHKQLSAEVELLRNEISEMDKRSKALQQELDTNADMEKRHERTVKRRD